MVSTKSSKKEDSLAPAPVTAKSKSKADVDVDVESDAADSKVSEDYQILCRELNMDSSTISTAWDSYSEIRKKYTLEVRLSGLVLFRCNKAKNLFPVGPTVALAGLCPVCGVPQQHGAHRRSGRRDRGQRRLPDPTPPLLQTQSHPVLQQGQEVGRHVQPQQPLPE